MSSTDVALALLRGARVGMGAVHSITYFVSRIDFRVAIVIAAEHALGVLHRVNEPFILARLVGFGLVLRVRAIQVVRVPLNLVLNGSWIALDVDHGRRCSNLVDEHLLSVRLESLGLLLLLLSLVLQLFRLVVFS